MDVDEVIARLRRVPTNHVLAVSTARTLGPLGEIEFVTGAVVTSEYGALLDVGSGVVINSRRCVIASKVLLESGEWCLYLNEEQWGSKPEPTTSSTVWPARTASRDDQPSSST